MWNVCGIHINYCHLNGMPFCFPSLHQLMQKAEKYHNTRYIIRQENISIIPGANNFFFLKIYDSLQNSKCQQGWHAAIVILRAHKYVLTCEPYWWFLLGACETDKTCLYVRTQEQQLGSCQYLRHSCQIQSAGLTGVRNFCIHTVSTHSKRRFGQRRTAYTTVVP